MALDTAHGIAVAGALIGIGVGAVGAAVGDGLAGAQMIAGVARQPEAQSRLITWTFVTVGLAEAVYFINLVLVLVFYFIFAK
ncbi:MAG: ATP synthase F0 subunit C [Candidatus Dormibacteria bacterium]